MQDNKAFLYFGAVMQMLMSIIGAGVLGYFLEKWISAKGLLMVLSIIIGVVIAFIILYRKVLQIDKM